VALKKEVQSPCDRQRAEDDEECQLHDDPVSPCSISFETEQMLRAIC
jgi:hypothetical protein